MNKLNKSLVGIIVAIFYSGLSYGYEVSTHAALTREAYQRSMLKNTDLIQRIGLSSLQQDLGEIYFDINPGSGAIVARRNNPTEAGSKIGIKNYTLDRFNYANAHLKENIPTFISVPGWLMVGAIREDDLTFNISSDENPPQDDPQGSFDRVLNHFYDPSRGGAGLEGGYIFGGIAAPTWAIEGEGLPGKKNNHYSIKSAREAMFRAMTLRTVENSQLKTLPTPTIGTGVGKTIDFNSENTRKAYWATVFRALGDVSHDLQDMASPQHTRSDRHAGMGCVPNTEQCIGGNASFYEKYLEAKITNEKTFVLPRRLLPESEPVNTTSPPIDSSPPSYENYAIPRFNDFMSYYTGGIYSNSYIATGLANYSNMGFYSAGTNVGNADPHERPPKDATLLGKEELGRGHTKKIENMAKKIIEDEDAQMTLLTYPVIDNLQGTSKPDARLSTYSVFDQFLEEKGEKPVYTLNHYNYDEMIDLLLPRAVGYSAGLIDYFFRGRMEISPPKEGIYGLVDHANFAPPNAPTDPINGFKGFDKIKLKLKNTTEAVQTIDNKTYPQTMSDGFFVAVVKFYRNKKYTDDLDGELLQGSTEDDYLAQRSETEEIVVSKPVTLASPLAYGEEIELSFDFSEQELPINAWSPVRLSVAFRGKLGNEEDAVVIAEKPISSPLFITVGNERDHLVIGNACYTYEYLQDNDARREGLYSWLISNCQGARWPTFGIRETCKGGDAAPAFLYLGQSPNQVYIAWSGGDGLPVRGVGRIAFLMGDERVNLTAYGSAPFSRQFSYENKSDEIPYFQTHRGAKIYDGLLTGFYASTLFSIGVSTCHAYGSEPLPLDKYPQPVSSMNW